MAFEDFTTWDENDPQGELSVATNEITATLVKNYGACVDKNYGSNYFSGTFTHYVDFSFTSIPGQACLGVWSISDIDDWTYADLASGGLCIYYFHSGDDPGIYIEKSGTSQYFEIYLSTSTRYYLKITRDSSNDVRAYLYDDAAHTNLIAGPNATAVNFTTACDYLSLAWNDNDAFGWSGTIYNLDVGAGGGAGRNPVPMGFVVE